LNARTAPLDGGSNCGPPSLMGHHPACDDKMSVSKVHVVHHDRQMLEPQIVAPAVPRVWPALPGELHQGDVLRAEPHHDLHGANIPTPSAASVAMVGASSRNDTKPQPVPVEGLRTVQVRHNAADPQDALCLELAAPFHATVNGNAAGKIRPARQVLMLLIAP
jgi:hypothetical protein